MTDATPRDPPSPRAGFWRRKMTLRAWGGVVAAGITIYLVLPPSEGCACGTPAGYRSALKSELSIVGISEEAFFADSLRYTRDLAAMKHSESPGVRVTVDTATALGYRARAEYAPSQPIKRRAGSCVLWVGESAFAVATVPEGEPRCWVPRRPLWRYGAYRPPGPVLQ